MSRTPRAAAPSNQRQLTIQPTVRERVRSAWYGTSTSRLIALVIIAVLAVLAFRSGGAWLAHLFAIVRGAQAGAP